jgi:hypothetical protein
MYVNNGVSRRWRYLSIRTAARQRSFSRRRGSGGLARRCSSCTPARPERNLRLLPSVVDGLVTVRVNTCIFFHVLSRFQISFSRFLPPGKPRDISADAGEKRRFCQRNDGRKQNAQNLTSQGAHITSRAHGQNSHRKTRRRNKI